MSFPSFSVHSQRHERTSSSQNQNNSSSHSTLLSSRFTFCFRGLSTLRNLKYAKNCNKSANDSDFDRKETKKPDDNEKLDMTLWVPLHLSVKAATDTLLLIHHHFVHQRQRKIFLLNEKLNQVSESSDANDIIKTTIDNSSPPSLPPISKLLRSNPKAQALISELFAEAKSDLDLMKTVSSSLKTLNLFADSAEGNNTDIENKNNYASLLTCSHPNIKLIWRGKLLVGDSSKEEGEHKTLDEHHHHDDEKQKSYHYVRIETMGHFALTRKRLLDDDSVLDEVEKCSSSAKDKIKLSSATTETEKIYIFNASRHGDDSNTNPFAHTDDIASSSSSMPSSSNSSSPIFNNNPNSATEKVGLYSYRHNDQERIYHGKKRRNHNRDKRFHETSSSISSLSELLYSYQGSVGDDLDYLAENSKNNINSESQGIDDRTRSPQNAGNQSTTASSSFAATPTSKNSLSHQNNFGVASPKQTEIQENLMSVYRAVTNTTPQQLQHHHHHHPSQKNHQRRHSNISNVSSLCSGVALNRSYNSKDGDDNHAIDELFAVHTPIMSLEKTKEYVDHDDDADEMDESDNDENENDSAMASESRKCEQQQHIHHHNETPAPARVSFAPRQPVEERWLDSEANAIWKQKRKEKNKSLREEDDDGDDEDDEDSLLIEDAESRRKFAWWKKWASVFKRNNSNNPATTSTNITNTVNDVASSIIAPPEVTLDDDEAAEPEYIIPVGTIFLSIFKQLVLVAFGFMMNLITLVVFLPGLNVPRRAQVLMGTGALLNIIVAWHLVGTVELDVVV